MKQKFSFSFYFQIILLQIICFVIFRLRITDAQISFENPCPDISVVRNFNVTKVGKCFDIDLGMIDSLKNCFKSMQVFGSRLNLIQASSTNLTFVFP